MAKSRKSNVVQFTQNKVDVISAQSNEKILEGTYKTTAALNLRKGAGKEHAVITVLRKGAEVVCDGSYTMNRDQIWLYVRSGNYHGYCDKKYLCEVKKNDD